MSSSYTEVFGGAVLFPAGQTYLSLTFSTDQVLSWPIEQQIGGNIVASIVDLNPTATGLNVDIPDARQVSNGVQSVFNNIGANTVTVRDAAGGTIVSLASGEAWVAYLADNSTLAGVWRIFQLGASVSVANASALAGAGLKAVSSTLNQTIAPTSTATTPVTWTNSDRAQLTIWTGGVGILNLPAPGTAGSDWFAMVRNSGTGDLTITPPSGVIDGSATIAMAPSESAIIITDGTNFFTVGFGQASTSIFDFITINVAGSGDYTLSGVELNRISYRFTGILTGNRSVVVPASVQQYWVDNSTTGAFSLDVKSSAQVLTAPVIIQGGRNILYCDGVDVVNAESNTIGFPVTIAQGGTNATTAAVARTNLAVAASGLNLIAGLGITGGGLLTADRTFDLDTAHVRNVDHSAVSITAGAGMTGGGAIDATRTLDAGAGVGITVNANDIAMDIIGLTLAGVDAAADSIAFYDNNVGAVRRILIQNLLAALIQSGLNFTPTWGGFSTAPVNAIDYAIIAGWLCVMNCNPGNSGTSNATTMTINNVPANARPAAATRVNTILLDNGISSNDAAVHISTAGVMTFGFNAITGGFTASGTKGLSGNWALMYPLI